MRTRAAFPGGPRGAAAVLALALLPLAATAEQSRDALFTVMARHDCTIAQDQVAGIFAPEGFTPDFVRDTLSELLLDGTASQDYLGRLSLPPELCPPDAPAPTPREEFLQAFRDADCTLKAADLPALQQSLGASEAQLRTIAISLYDAQQLTVSGGSATLAPGLCATDEEG